MRFLILILILVCVSATFAQVAERNPVAAAPVSDVPEIELGVSQELARWRASRYSDVRYKLNLTLEKMSPVLKGTIEIRVKVSEPPVLASGQSAGQAETRPLGSVSPIILDWRKIKGHEEKSTISNVFINGEPASPSKSDGFSRSNVETPEGVTLTYEEINEHLVFLKGVVAGENVIRLDFTSPILTSGSAITRYVDKEDGSEYIYSLFVPSDASTAFPVFDQPDLKARFRLHINLLKQWRPVSNGKQMCVTTDSDPWLYCAFEETKPISTYVFAFAAGPLERVSDSVSSPHVSKGSTQNSSDVEPSLTVGLPTPETSIYVRKSQAEKFKPHAAEVFRLNREAIKYFEEYFDYKFPFPKYDLVLIPEFPFGGMEHAGATFLRESAIIFPQEPTRNDHISRALLIFHEASHQWFGDTVTMRWFDDLWLKEGFATFTAYKAMEKIMPETNAWKVFYERVKQAAYQTDSTKGTTPIYQEIPNLSAAKSAYGAIVYSKAPAFLRQAEFYLGEDKFQTAVRAFLKKHEFGNAGWEDLVKEFEGASKRNLQEWAKRWVTQRGMPKFSTKLVFKADGSELGYSMEESDTINEGGSWQQKTKLYRATNLLSGPFIQGNDLPWEKDSVHVLGHARHITLMTHYYFPNYGDYGYGIFLLDDKSRDYVLKNIQNEKDPFLRSMMWGALWDSVREGELDPRVYVELVVKVLGSSSAGGRTTPSAGQKATGIHPSFSKEGSQEDESTTALLLNRVGTALNYYIDPVIRSQTNMRTADTIGLAERVENMLITGMINAATQGQRITYYRAFLQSTESDNARGALKAMLKASMESRSRSTSTFPPGLYSEEDMERILRFEEMIRRLPLKTKDRFDIVTRLLILGDPDAPKLLADLEKTETSDDAKRYAYAAKAGIPTAENKAKYWNDFTNNKEISESWIEAAFGPWNSIRHSELTLPYLQRALQELPNHKRDRKIFFVNGWLGAFIGGQRSEEALGIVNKFLADNPGLDNDLRLKILENSDLIERAIKIRGRYP
jgi:aminopeptidase N